jgi:hypothetical protein
MVLTGSLFTVSLHAQSNYKISQVFPIPGAGKWDCITVDEASNKLYVSHGTEVNILPPVFMGLPLLILLIRDIPATAN